MKTDESNPAANLDGACTGIDQLAVRSGVTTVPQCLCEFRQMFAERAFAVFVERIGQAGLFSFGFRLKLVKHGFRRGFVGAQRDSATDSVGVGVVAVFEPLRVHIVYHQLVLLGSRHTNR